VWHSGDGSFRGVKPYDTLNVRDNRFADVGLGVECVSKGLRKDFTSRQKWALGYLANACRVASGWSGFYKRLPNHRTWAPTRKIDSRYELRTLRLWAVRARARRITR
jgi:N-acetyl-anhydromuramyl-L-alanine amidase AmpD